jgi:hypothetical protein
MRRSLLVAGILALSSTASTAVAGEDPAAVKILEALNTWCHASNAATVQCAVAENPRLDPTVAVHPDTVKRIAGDRARLRKLGVEITWASVRFQTQAEIDVTVIIGGHFGVDHIGPGPHNEIKTRAAAQPSLYVGTLDRILGASPSHTSLSSLFVPFAIEMFAARGAKVEAIALAKRLIPHYEAALKLTPPGDAGYTSRVTQRLDALKAFVAKP